MAVTTTTTTHIPLTTTTTTRRSLTTTTTTRRSVVSIPIDGYIVTGTSSSRLSELEKYTITNIFSNKYVINGSYSVDGVDISASNQNESIIYFIGGIRYVDVIVNGVTVKTTFNFYSKGYDSPDFINVPIYKNPNKENIISNPKILNDVFIIRQELSAFDKNYRLEFIKNLVDLTTYAGGNFFNIVNNS